MSSPPSIDPQKHHCDCMCPSCERAGTGYYGFFLTEEEAAQKLAPAHQAIIQTYGKLKRMKQGKLRYLKGMR